MIRDVLLSRGWENGGSPAGLEAPSTDDVKRLPKVLAKELPRRALYIVGEDGKEPKSYLRAFLPLPDPASRFRITM